MMSTSMSMMRQVLNFLSIISLIVIVIRTVKIFRLSITR